MRSRLVKKWKAYTELPLVQISEIFIILNSCVCFLGSNFLGVASVWEQVILKLQKFEFWILKKALIITSKMGAFFKIQNSNFCHLRMGEDNLMKLSGIIAQVSLCLNLKGNGRGV